ncbi:hypothetical protein VNI00_010324 [Paramarasmius palmivorus]|uniref:Uncharacterized protein n=1 Tax=Paramarasmius palmivorus TaxID=297713 RepID=A0AAW0CKU4_9AGAR
MARSHHNVAEALKHLFDGRITRQSHFFSPFLTGTDQHVDALLVRALEVADHPTFEDESPLTTPPSTPPTSPRCHTLALSEDEDTSSPTLGEESSPSLPHPIPAKRTVRTRRVNLERDKKKSKLNRLKKRQQRAIQICNSTTAAQQFEPSARIFTSVRPVPEQVSETHITPSSTGFIGVEKALPERREYTKEELLAMNFRLHRHNPDSPCPILHSPTQSVMCLIQPAPRDSSWPLLIRHLNSQIEKLRPRCRFKEARLTVRQRRLAKMGLGGPHALAARRGRFRHLSHGISFGNGQKVPKILRQDPKNQPILDEIRSDRMFQRLAGWMSIGFLTWAPKLFLYYVQVLGSLVVQYPHLHRPFPNSIFSAFTLNFGPTTVCFPHRDFKNLAFGWCAITALGDYDWTQGGHLVLWDLKLLIEFPPGTTIYIPSAILCHLNTTIQPHERRYSFTMYSAGGLFRWVEHGFQTEKMYSKTVSAARQAADNAARWQSGLGLFSTLDELRGTGQ